MRVLLTGGFGYIGGRLAQMLAATTDHEVTLGTRRMAPPPQTAPGANVVAIDWSSEPSLLEACKGIDIVVHLAGMSAADCARDPVAALEFNAGGTARLVAAAVRQSVSRFVYLSTAHVYGAALTGVVDELTCPQPRHPYATSHRAGEDVVRLAHGEATIEGIVVRLSNSFGAPVDPRGHCWSLLINDLCLQSIRTRRAILKTEGTQRRDFLAISEACRAITHLLAIPALSLGDGVFNVGSGWAPTTLEAAGFVVARIEELLGFRPEIQKGAARDAIGDGRLDFRVQRLVNTGFELRRQASTQELDKLIAFCVQYESRIAT